MKPRLLAVIAIAVVFAAHNALVQAGTNAPASTAPDAAPAPT